MDQNQGWRERAPHASGEAPSGCVIVWGLGVNKVGSSNTRRAASGQDSVSAASSLSPFRWTTRGYVAQVEGRYSSPYSVWRRQSRSSDSKGHCCESVIRIWTKVSGLD